MPDTASTIAGSLGAGGGAAEGLHPAPERVAPAPEGAERPFWDESGGRIVLGLGCDRGTPLATLLAAIDQALHGIGAAWPQVVAMASIDLKADEAAMQQLMAERGMPIRFFTAAQLAGVPVPNPSEVVRKYTGTPSVSEAAALLMAGQVARPLLPPAPPSALLVEKHKLRGPDGRNATVSIAACTGGASGG